MTKIRTELSAARYKFSRKKQGLDLDVQKTGLNLGARPGAHFICVSTDAVSYQEIDVTGHKSNMQGQIGKGSETRGTTSEKLLDEINSKRRKRKQLPVVIVLALILIFTGIASSTPFWVLVIGALLLITVMIAFHIRDDISKTTVLFYELSHDMKEKYAQFFIATSSLTKSQRIWNLISNDKAIDPKYNAGASSHVGRIRSTIKRCAPPFIQTNVEVFCLEHLGQSVYFFPDQILVFNEICVRSVPYSTLQIEQTTINFAESEDVPTDALVVGRTWRFVNKSGGPDKRFKDNPELPLCNYEIVRINSAVGFNQEIMLSRCDLIENFIEALNSLKKYVSTINARKNQFDLSESDNFGYPTVLRSADNVSNVITQIQTDPSARTLIDFLRSVGPPPSFNFYAIDKILPEGLKLHGQKYVEVVSAKVEKSLGDSCGRICILKYKSVEEASSDLKTMLFYTGKYVLNPIQSDFRCIEKFYSNTLDDRFAFIGQTGHWIVHGVFPIRGSYEPYLEDLFAIDSGNHYLSNLIKNRTAKAFSNPESVSSCVKTVMDAEMIVNEKVENISAKSIGDIEDKPIHTSINPSVKEEISLQSNTVNQVPLFNSEETAILADALTTFVLPGEVTKLESSLSIPCSPEEVKASKKISVPRNNQVARWYSKNEAVRVDGFVIGDGLVFVGSKPEDLSNDIACLIEPSLDVAKQGDYRTRSMGYWPHYSNISAEARASYLKWLSLGKNDPEADIGYVFLYFYGLEKRYFDFRPSGIPSEFDMSEIYEELTRLKEIYGAKNKSFGKYLDVFLELVHVTTITEKLYNLELPELDRHRKTAPLYLQVLIGQAMRDQFPLSFPLLKYWVSFDAKFNLSAVPAKQESQSWFWHIIETDLKADYPSGLIVPDSDSVLRFDYSPASPPWTSELKIPLMFENIPDMNSVSGFYLLIQSYIDNAVKTFEPLKKLLRYSKNISTDELTLMLPAKYWKVSVLDKLNALLDRNVESTEIIYGSDFNEVFAAAKGLSNQVFKHVANQLEHIYEVRIIPSAEEFVVPPTSSDRLIIYKILNEENTISIDAQNYKQVLYVADTTIELAAFVAQADTVFSLAEFEWICGQIDSWIYLSANDRLRFKLKLKLLQLQQRGLSSIQSRLKNLLPEDKMKLATFIRHLACVDGGNSHQAAQFIGNIYSLLEISEVSANDSVVKEDLVSPVFVLDREKIAELQKESQQISLMLGAIFEDEQKTTHEHVVEAKEIAVPLVFANEEKEKVELLKGLDKVHAQFLTRLIARTEWSRTDVEAISRELGLMTDGAIERINDAAFEQFDMSLVEGEDPIEINVDLIENLSL